ncbi:MAG: hypothetical protein IPN01_31380 [Deltaproteobacteria bacterium]|nr:hypothetical protein [Deltaproteobacteria bacterium]
MGPATAAALRAGVEPTMIPATATGAGLAAALGVGAPGAAPSCGGGAGELGGEG